MAVVSVLCVIARGKGGLGIMVVAVLVALAVPILSATTFFHEGTDQMTMRIYDAGQSEGNAEGFANRFVYTMAGPIATMGDVPFFGEGLGIDTNAAAAMLRGEREFIGPEDEWGRLIYECGPILGLFLCIFRVALTISVARSAYAAFHHGNILPVLIFTGCGLSILNGQWGVPTTLDSQFSGRA